MQEMQVMQGLIFWSGRSPGVGNGNLLQCSCLENSMDRGPCWATVHEVSKTDTIERVHARTHTHTHTHKHTLNIQLSSVQSLSHVRLFVSL